MGIALGLFLGKPIGIFGCSFAAIRLKLAGKPEGATWPQIFGVAILGGIGFTMSLFIGMLAFTGPEHAAEIRIGVLARLASPPRSRVTSSFAPSRRAALDAPSRPCSADGRADARRAQPCACRYVARPACRAAFTLADAPLVVLLRQLVPLDRERAAGAAVLAVPVGQEIEAGVVDVVELD